MDNSKLQMQTPPQRITLHKPVQREVSFFHEFKDEEISDGMRITGRYCVEVTFTLDDNDFIIDTIMVCGDKFYLPVEFSDLAWDDNSVYQHAVRFITNHAEEFWGH